MSEEFNFSRRFLNKESEECAKRHSILSTSSTLSTSAITTLHNHRDSLLKYNLRPRKEHQIPRSQKTSASVLTSASASTSTSTSTSNNDSITSNYSLQNESQEFLIFSSEEDSEVEVEGTGAGSEKNQPGSASQSSSAGVNEIDDQEMSSETSENFDDLAYLHECDSEDEMVPIFANPHPDYHIKNKKSSSNSINNNLHKPKIIKTSLPCDTSLEFNLINIKNETQFAEVKNELLRKEKTILGSFVPLFAFCIFFLIILITFILIFGEPKDYSTNTCSQKNPFFSLSYK